MAEIPVEKKGMSPWVMGLIALVALLAIWFVWQNLVRDRGAVDTIAPAAMTEPAPATDAPTATPGATNGTMAALPGTNETAAAPADTAPTDSTPLDPTPGDRVTDAGAYAAASDKLSLVDREAVLSDMRVAQVVGPKSFTLTSGSEELMVLIDPQLNRGVGTQGQISQGDTINLKGNFQRIQPDEIDNIASNRFRDLTEPERDWLRKTQVYLHATEFSKIN